MLAIERKNNILAVLRTSKLLSVKELAEQFNSSKETIRRDLRDFEQQGLVKKTHGGVMLVEDNGKIASPVADPVANYSELPINIRRKSRSREKESICAAAAEYLSDHDVIYVDASSTTISLVNYIPAHLSITVLTNSITVILEASKLNNPNISLFSVPGFFNSNNLSLNGHQTVKMVDDFFPNKAFFSCAAIMSDSRLADTCMGEIDTKLAFMQKSEKVFLLADATKFNQTAPYLLSDMDLVDYIITDHRAENFNWQLLDSKSVEVRVCGL